MTYTTKLTEVLENTHTRTTNIYDVKNGLVTYGALVNVRITSEPVNSVVGIIADAQIYLAGVTSAAFTAMYYELLKTEEYTKTKQKRLTYGCRLNTTPTSILVMVVLVVDINVRWYTNIALQYIPNADIDHGEIVYLVP
jgi:hypothetical protein